MSQKGLYPFLPFSWAEALHTLSSFLNLKSLSVKKEQKPECHRIFNLKLLVNWFGLRNEKKNSQRLLNISSIWHMSFLQLGLLDCKFAVLKFFIKIYLEFWNITVLKDTYSFVLWHLVPHWFLFNPFYEKHN